MRTVHGKIFLSHGVSDEKVFNNELLLRSNSCSIAHENIAKLYITMHSFNVHFTQTQTHNDNQI